LLLDVLLVIYVLAETIYHVLVVTRCPCPSSKRKSQSRCFYICFDWVTKLITFGVVLHVAALFLTTAVAAKRTTPCDWDGAS
jgi:hypothetical protein